MQECEFEKLCGKSLKLGNYTFILSLQDSEIVILEVGHKVLIHNKYLLSTQMKVWWNILLLNILECSDCWLI